jgi:hypothetical protein
MESGTPQDVDIVRAVDNGRRDEEELGRYSQMMGGYWDSKDEEPNQGRDFGAHCMASQRELDLGHMSSRFQTPVVFE